MGCRSLRLQYLCEKHASSGLEALGEGAERRTNKDSSQHRRISSVHGSWGKDGRDPDRNPQIVNMECHGNYDMSLYTKMAEHRAYCYGILLLVRFLLLHAIDLVEYQAALNMRAAKSCTRPLN